MNDDGKQRSAKIQKAIAHLQRNGTGIAKIAVKLGVSPWTINSWITGARHPRESSIRSLENAYKIKVL